MSNKTLVKIDGTDYIIDVDKGKENGAITLAPQFKSGDVFKRPDGYKRAVAYVGENLKQEALFTLLGINLGFNVDITELSRPVTAKEMQVFLAERRYTKVGNVNNQLAAFWRANIIP